MYCTRKVTESVHWVGASDRRLALFENLFPIPRGVSYNSYLIVDEKTALLDTADASVSAQFMENVLHVLDGRPLDYLVVNHMEPDHCANIAALALRFPEMQIVGNAKTFVFLNQFYDLDLTGRTVTVKEGDTLSLGSHTLRFVLAPMVHWPEVMVAYEEAEKLLFSADAFGSFGAINGNLFQDEIDFDRDWLDDARRYYTNIVGKYGPQVQAALKKLAGVDIAMICPLHGPVWRGDLGYLLGKYDLWSRYEPEDKAVAIFYASMYGDTENAANVLAAALAERGVKKIAVYDVSVTHVSTLIAEAFRCSHLVFAAPTYNAGVYPAMANLLEDMKNLNLQNRTVGLMENGTWAPMAGKQMRAALEGMKRMRILEPAVTVKSALKADSRAAIGQLADTILADLVQEA
ncbi:MAG TPA: FprA family A-type flavoprotein [Candidatus Onthomonas avicola]|nr:FprA family A-type flavoprotein [Candidatus Onthomonas avicola]